ncbi:unnamed protein product [Cylindrotheca closterium]|uniref:Uncharacterized protein n=1 Tax=Cylindrotheca closterium TaxID=2856 RepID=A0AAD2GB35_9STRA|nr:unnamed protein product [Cylindrotheca closterium]
MKGHCLFILTSKNSKQSTTTLPPRNVTHVQVDCCATEIPNRIFRDCTQLCQVLFAERPQNKDKQQQEQQHPQWFGIGHRAFDTCILLQEVSIPSFVTIIGNLAFGDCRMLTTVKLSEGLKVLEGSSFYNCSSLKEVAIPSTVEVLGPGIFENCVRLVRVKLPEGLKAIEYSTFLYCKALQEVTIPSTVKRIGKSAFQCCESLQDIPFPHGLKRIEEGAFALCKSLGAISIPPAVDFIEYRAFENCSNLVAVQFQNGTNAKLRTASFRGLHSLMNIFLPQSMSPVKIVKGAFEDCTWLEAEFYHGNPSQHVPGRVDMAEHERVVEGLCNRYRSLPLHRFCYNPPTPHVLNEELLAQVKIDSISKECLRVDCFEMSPFHILASCANIRVDVFELLLALLDPLTAHKCCSQLDRRGKSCIDYLMTHPSRSQKESFSMIRYILERTFADRLSKWGLKDWHPKMSRLIKSIDLNVDADKRAHLLNKVYKNMAMHERHEKSSLLELALWNMELTPFDTLEIPHHSLDRGPLRIRCGANVVIPHVTSFL